MLWKKMIRDIWSNWGSYVACLVVVFIGLTVFTAFSIVVDNLGASKELFYREQNFADGFAELVAMPANAVEGLSRIEGVRDLSGRIVEEVRVNLPEREDSVYLKLVSLDLKAPNRVNDVRLLEGTELTEGELQAWIDNKFAAAHGLELGDSIEIIVGGRVRELNVQGVGMSPEFTYPLRTAADFYPNPEQFGIAFLPMGDMGTLFPEMAGSVNDLVFTLEQGANFERVRDRLEPELEQYGLITMYPREEQISHLVLTEELVGLETVSRSFPLLFLSIAALILYIMLKRLVEQQRGQIGILKAIGYSNREISLHYLSYALTIGAVGGLLGGIAGMFLATPLTDLLLEFFTVPEFYEGFSPYYLFLGLLLSLGIFLLAGYQGSKPALKLKPAEGMRPPAPVSGKKTLLEGIGFFANMLTIQGKMALRNLARNRGRSAFMFVGITLSCAVVILTYSFNDLIDKMLFYQFEQVETYDARVTLSRPRGRLPVQRELEGHGEVVLVEPLAEVPVTLTHNWLKEDVMVIGVAQGSRMYNILDSDGRRVEPQKGGIILSERLAGKLNVGAGSSIELNSPFLRNNDREPRVEVAGVIPQYLGVNAYMELSDLEAILNQGEMATSFMVNVREQAGIAALRDRYRESEVVAGVDGIEERISMYKELLDTFGSIFYLYVFIGVIIAFAIIYSSSFIILSERSREMASMRVLGMTSEEVFSVITFEQWFLSLFAILAGIPLAQLMQAAMAREMSTDLYVLPASVSLEALAVGAMITAAAVWLAQRFALRKVRSLSLVEVLKTRE